METTSKKKKQNPNRSRATNDRMKAALTFKQSMKINVVTSSLKCQISL